MTTYGEYERIRKVKTMIWMLMLMVDDKELQLAEASFSDMGIS